MKGVGPLSFSGIKTYDQCPHKFYRLKVLKDVKDDFSGPEAVWGNEVHKALEEFIRDGKPLSERFKQFQEYAERLRRIDGDHYVEKKLAITDDGAVKNFFSDEADHRCIIDFLVVRNNRRDAIALDHKTGKIRPTKQLHYNALMVFAAFPRVDVVRAAFYWLPKDTFTKYTIHREEIDDVWQEFERPLVGLEESVATGEWPRKSTPLCGWCPVTDCPFNTKHERG